MDPDPDQALDPVSTVIRVRIRVISKIGYGYGYGMYCTLKTFLTGNVFGSGPEPEFVNV
jgi:hypothetical protein